MVVGSTLTCRAARIGGMVGSVSAAFSATSAFHSALVLGTTFQIGLSGRAMMARIWGLTVVGTGIVRGGNCRAPAGEGACCADADEAARVAIRPRIAHQPRYFI